jgi:hypothetical protein
MRRSIVLVALLVLHAAADVAADGVDDGVDDSEEQTRILMEKWNAFFTTGNGFYRYGDSVLRADLDVGVAASTDVPVSANVAATVAWDLPLCRVIGASGTSQAGYVDKAAVVAYTLTGTVCLPLPANTFQLAYTRRGNLQTSLLEGPMVVQDRRTSDVFDFSIWFWRWRGVNHQIEIAPVTVNIDVSRNTDDGGYGAIWSRARMQPVRWMRLGKGLRGGDQTWDFMIAQIVYQDDDATVGGRDAGVGTISPVRIDGLALGDHLAVGADLGWQLATGVDGAETLISRRAFHGEVWVDAAVGPVTGSVHVSRGYLPTFDAQLVLDHRVTAKAALTQAAWTVRGEGFVAHELVERAGGPATRVVVGGAAGDLAIPLGRRAHAVARVEAARTLAPALAMDPVTARADLRATVGVTMHFGSAW